MESLDFSELTNIQFWFFSEKEVRNSLITPIWCGEICLVSSNYSSVSSAYGDNLDAKSMGFPRWQFPDSYDKTIEIEPYAWTDCTNEVRPTTEQEIVKYLIQNEKYRENKDRNDFLLFALKHTNKAYLLMTETVIKELQL